MSAVVGLCGCSGFERVDSEPIQAPVDVVMSVGGVSSTRTAYDPDVRNFVWNDGDKIAVWAKSQDGSYSLNCQTFNLLASRSYKSGAYFTATLQAPMEQGSYTYYMSYPLPESVEGTNARFTVSAVQDGSASDGVDIIVAEPVVAPELSPLVEASPIDQDNVLTVTMKHILHYLRFYIPEGQNVLGEPVTRIEFTMPRPVAGSVSVDVADASTASLPGGVASMRLDLKAPIEDKVGSEAVAGIFPPSGTYGSEDQMTVTVYSDSKWADLPPVRLDGRSFPAGHVTPVPLKPTDAKPLLWFTLDSNNLGEDPQNVKLSLPTGDNWPGTDSNVLAFTGEHDGLIKVGDTFVFKADDDEAFRNLSSKALTVTYESESAIVTENVTIGDLSSMSKPLCTLNCPYLFFEDFSGVKKDFTSDDGYVKGWPFTGSKDPKTDFLEGWSAARAGGQSGTAIRIACRGELAGVNYPARADSPFLSGIKDGMAVDLSISYDYSMNRQGLDISQTVYFGYTDKAGGIKSGDDSGTFTDSFEINETTGSYSNIDHEANVVLSGMTSSYRLSWRTIPKSDWKGYTTCWLYIDNIKVKIKK